MKKESRITCFVSAYKACVVADMVEEGLEAGGGSSIQVMGKSGEDDNAD